jgi:uncharacterized protein YqeY
MTRPGDNNLRDRLRQALAVAMKARDRPAVAALRSALAAIDNAEAVDPAQALPGPGAGHPDESTREPGRPELAATEPGHPKVAGSVVGVGATEVERRSLSPAQLEGIVRAEIADREAAAADYEGAGQVEQAERLRAEAGVLLSHLNTT